MYDAKCTQQSSFVESTSRIPARGGATRVRRFNGTTRRTSDWDGLRKDGQLWFEQADCLVYFYTERASQRGASLKIPFEAVQRLKCKHLLEKCLRRRSSRCALSVDGGKSEGTYTRLRNDSDPHTVKYELFIPAPAQVTREQAFSFHLTTRNLFAYAVGGALVGETLSKALIDLWKRIQEWQLPVRSSDFTAYLEKQGYLDFTENTEHSLACLKLAEYARLPDVWIDSFVHCVGMHGRLDLSPEFAGISNSTQARITRAALERDLHIDKTLRTVGSFLEDDFGSVNLGLSKPAREHLDYFRSFLNGFFVNKFGYFPPPAGVCWNKRPWTSMYNDFQNLYDYLADTKSSNDWTTNGGVTGGICVVQNVQSFDLRHNYPALEHPLPLLPRVPPKQRSGLAHVALPPLMRGRTRFATEPKVGPVQLLTAATSSHDTKAMRCPLVQEYLRFETENSDGKVDIVEARKVRWLLIYGVLQTLNSIIKAPAEVKDPETPSYPLCVSTGGCPPWDDNPAIVDGGEIESEQPSRDIMLVPEALDDLEGRASRISIRPDCEADCAEDYFASMNIYRQDSNGSSSVPPSPLKRTGSIRSSMQLSVQALQKSVAGSLSRRNSSRRATIGGELKRSHTEPADLKKSRSVCEIVVEDVQTDQPSTEIQDGTVSSSSEEIKESKPFYEFDFGFGTTPDLKLQQWQSNSQSDMPNSESENTEDTITSPCESESGGSSGGSTASKRSSYTALHAESPTTDLSSFDGGSRRGSTTSDSTVQLEFSAPKKQLSYQPSNPNMDQKGSRIGVHSGTYIPKGMVSKSSSSSSAEPPKPVVVKKEKKTRRRRTSSGLSGLSEYGIVLGKKNVW